MIDMRVSDDPSRIVLVQPRREGVEYYAEHAHGWIYVVTNADGAYNFKLVKRPLADSSGMVANPHSPIQTLINLDCLREASWIEVVPHSTESKIEDLDMFTEHIVLFENCNGLPRVRSMSHDGNVALLRMAVPNLLSLIKVVGSIQWPRRQM